MELNEVLSLLESGTITVLKSRKRACRYTEVAFLERTEEADSLIAPDTICFSTALRFNAIDDGLLAGGSFFLEADEPIGSIPADTTVVTCQNKEDLYSCYERIVAEFRALRRVKSRLLDLTAFASSGAGLKAIINRVSDIFRLPANILDTSLAIVVHSDPYPDWAADGVEKGNGFLPERAQVLLKDLGLTRSTAPIETTVFSWEDASGTTCYNHFTPISIGSTIIGSFSVLSQNAPMRKSRADLLSVVANILSIEMQKTSSYLANKSVYYSHLFEELLDGSLTESPDAIKYRFSVFGYTLKECKNIFYVDMSGDYYDASQVQAAAERFHRVLENNVYVVRDRSIILLTSVDERIDIVGGGERFLRFPKRQTTTATETKTKRNTATPPHRPFRKPNSATMSNAA